MATVTPKPSLSRAETQSRVSHPLQQLRGIIRFYVTAEGLAAAAVYLAACFWFGLALDYGIFKITGLDWIQILPWEFRGTVLALATIGLLALVAFKVVTRLAFEFRNSALALVLERRFPKLLGDRLITAVELADSKKAATYGYSQAMIDYTIQEAAERVGQAPVREVFNWRRLVMYGLMTVVLTVGAYLLVGATYCTAEAALAEQPDNFVSFAQRFNQVAGIWFERNVLMRDVPWPRRAMLVITDFAEPERRIGRDAPAMALNVQAYKWVVADASAPEGWRPLSWTDLPTLLESPPDITTAGLAAHGILPGATVDEIESFLKKPDAPSTGLERTQQVFEQLDTLAASIPMQRMLRKLEIPEEVRLYYKGTTRGSSLNSMQTMEAVGDHRRFTCTLPELKEDVKLWAKGVDYTTPTKTIRVVPPPELNHLLRSEDHPAYLYYRMPRSASSQALRGKKQQIRNQLVSLSGDTIRLEVPFGTDLTLDGKVSVFENEDLYSVSIKPTAGVKEKHPIRMIDGKTFQVRFDNITTTLDFAFEFVDRNNVTGFRHVVIKPQDDAAPEIDVQIEVLRKTNAGYLATPLARIPFSGKVKDDRGVALAEYGYTVARMDTAPAPTLQALVLGKLVGWTAIGPIPGVSGLAREKIIGKADVQESAPATAALKTFAIAANEKDRYATPVALLDGLLGQAPPDRSERELRFIREFTLNADEEFFDVERLALKATDENAAQPRYRLRLWMQATDNNVETGPGTGQSKEKFTVLIISENELLSEIAKEEEGLNAKLQDAVDKLKDNRLKLEKVQTTLSGLKPEEVKKEFRLVQETKDVGDALVKGGDVGREVLSDYRRILNEMKANRVQPVMINKVQGKIVEPLELVGDKDFPRAEESSRLFLKHLEAGQQDMAGAQQAMRDLDIVIDRLQGVLEAMEGITTINKLIQELVKIEKDEEAAADQLRKQYEEKLRIIIGDITDDEPKKPDPKKKPEKK